jgi:crossover junction endodeoxyribonuclease RusA
MIEIVFPQPVRPWSVNERLHHTRTAGLTRQWRGMAKLAAQSWRNKNRSDWNRHKNRPALVCVTIPFPDRRRRDPMNYTGTVVKAVVDGLVDAGLWPDDGPEWVEVADPVIVVDTTRRQLVTVTISLVSEAIR